MKQASVVVEIFVLLIAIVLTSAGILFLVQAGILSVKAETGDVSLLNTEFIPYGREGTLEITHFEFCQNVGDDYQCINPKSVFSRGDEIYFRFDIETTPLNGQIILRENYRVQAPDGKIVIDVDTRKDYFLNMESKKEEKVSFKDKLISEQQDFSGTYTVNLIVENPLINKKITLTKQFELK
ncbi:hypothetical protein HYX14_06110 [Candidatus Woesearchaeota archaeon]|nr:hypothetical protein [Candidatus Woesearchaeota archaeon]